MLYCLRHSLKRDTMLKSVILLMVVAVATALIDLEQLEKDDIIEAVNSAGTTWKAGRNFNPNIKKTYLKHLLGWKKRPEGSTLAAYVDDDSENIAFPKNFDARKKWKKCISLQEVRDQGPCGSCWAVAAAATFTDRLCIASKTAFNGHLSAEELVSCCDECGSGCNGGYDDAAWSYFESNGVVTGGDYKSHEGCQPYTLPACEHHVPGSRKNCSSYGDLPTPPCKNKCYNRKYKDHTFAQDHHKVKDTFTLGSDLKAVQKELFKNGPLESGFDVYEDFLSYKSGVYQHTSGDYLGGHAVKIIGWGVEEGTPYWLVANSWNSDWGDKGFFKIKRGTNECDFESDISGGNPDV